MAGSGMIVSILQLMGFPMAEPVHSRAGETPQSRPSKASPGTHNAKDHKPANSIRSDHVNAKSGKDPKSKVAAAKPQASVKAVATPTKAAPKVTVKAVTKAVVKAPAKAVAKVVTKVPAKASPKATVAAPAKPATKPVAKAVPAKAAKALTPAVPSKPAVASKPAAKPASPEKVSASMTTAATKSAPLAAPAAANVVTQKTGRPSSRLAQLTVPSMAQAVASTAAKASYSQSAPMPVIVPALPSSIKKDPKLANNWKTKPVAELSDAELMAMPDSEYMNDVQMAVFRLKLSLLKQDILASAGETTEHLREDTSVVPDPADRATIEEEHALELRTRDRERKLLKKIEQSIGRIDAGDYGYCDETGEPIGVGRLLARPTATLSLEAQQRRELKQKMFGD
jgi:DnaK suppressor protein